MSTASLVIRLPNPFPSRLMVLSRRAVRGRCGCRWPLSYSGPTALQRGFLVPARPLSHSVRIHRPIGLNGSGSGGSGPLAIRTVNGEAFCDFHSDAVGFEADTAGRRSRGFGPLHSTGIRCFLSPVLAMELAALCSGERLTTCHARRFRALKLNGWGARSARCGSALRRGFTGRR